MWRLTWLMALLLSLANADECLAIAGTSSVASTGQEVSPRDSWPEGVVELLNDPTRTEGWNDWFSEWPNDVCHYAFDVQGMDDVNRLLEKLAKIEAQPLHVHLSFLAEPKGLGWVTQLPEKNGIAVIYSQGDQARIDQWYGHVRKPFGVIEFTATPVAVPPTLTIFVQNAKIDLDQLKIPEGIEVTAGYLPGPFLRWNDQREQQAEKAPPAAAKAPELDEPSRQAVERIETFLKRRAE
jgi:hypothetical protein